MPITASWRNSRSLPARRSPACLDPGNRRLFCEYLRDYAKAEGKTVFLTSHIIQDLEKLVDEVIIMDYGNILVQKEAASLMGEYPGMTLEDIFIELTGKY